MQFYINSLFILLEKQQAGQLQIGESVKFKLNSQSPIILMVPPRTSSKEPLSFTTTVSPRLLFVVNGWSPAVPFSTSLLIMAPDVVGGKHCTSVCGDVCSQRCLSRLVGPSTSLSTELRDYSSNLCLCDFRLFVQKKKKKQCDILTEVQNFSVSFDQVLGSSACHPLPLYTSGIDEWTLGKLVEQE